MDCSVVFIVGTECGGVSEGCVGISDVRYRAVVLMVTGEHGGRGGAVGSSGDRVECETFVFYWRTAPP